MQYNQESFYLKKNNTWNSRWKPILWCRITWGVTEISPGSHAVFVTPTLSEKSGYQEDILFKISKTLIQQVSIPLGRNELTKKGVVNVQVPSDSGMRVLFLWFFYNTFILHRYFSSF